MRCIFAFFWWVGGWVVYVVKGCRVGVLLQSACRQGSFWADFWLWCAGLFLVLDLDLDFFDRGGCPDEFDRTILLVVPHGPHNAVPPPYGVSQKSQALQVQWMRPIGFTFIVQRAGFHFMDTQWVV
jgi:hypothetical protein